MPEYSLKYADARGEIHQQVMEAESETEIRQQALRPGLPCLHRQRTLGVWSRSRQWAAGSWTLRSS
ncbi:MAG: hypothetical protein MZV70_19365 [Desulfobacterales bacterium]|nr:hypothetical protein [Desulfobacterales bacterium]